MKKSLGIAIALAVYTISIQAAGPYIPEVTKSVGGFGYKLGDVVDVKTAVKTDGSYYSFPNRGAISIKPIKKSKMFTTYNASITPLSKRIVYLHASKEYKHGQGKCDVELPSLRLALEEKYGKFSKVFRYDNNEFYKTIDNQSIIIKCYSDTGLQIRYIDRSL